MHDKQPPSSPAPNWASLSPAADLLRRLQQWRGLLLFIAVMLVFRSAVADWNHVPSSSMVPSILVGDRIVVDKLAYRLRIPFTLHTIAEFDSPKRGDVVTFESPVGDQQMVKRVLGLPGDVVQMHGNLLIINGLPAHYGPPADAMEVDGYRLQVLREEVDNASHQIALMRQAKDAYQSFDPIKIPADHYLMLGDNRDLSQDSRKIGLVHKQLIMGRAHAVAFSLDLDRLRLRPDRFFQSLD